MAAFFIALSMTAMAQRDNGNQNRPPKEDPPKIDPGKKDPPKPEKPPENNNRNRPNKPQESVFVIRNQAEISSV